MACLMDRLRDMGTLSKVKHWSGISVGSLCALCCNIGIRLETIQPFLKKLKQLFQITPESMLSLPDSYGVISHEPFKELIHTILEEQGILPSITFSQLFRFTKQSLSMFACSTDQNELVCFNHHKTPNHQICDALLASCSIPFIFPRYRIQMNTQYAFCVDGGLLSDWAIDTDLTHPRESKTLLITTRYESSQKQTKIHSFLDYIYYFIHNSTQNIEKLTKDMRECKQDIFHTITLHFHTNPFSLHVLDESIDVIHTQVEEVLHSSIVKKDESVCVDDSTSVGSSIHHSDASV